MRTAKQIEDRAERKHARRVTRHFDAGLIEVEYPDGGFEVWMAENARTGFQMVRRVGPPMVEPGDDSIEGMVDVLGSLGFRVVTLT